MSVPVAMIAAVGQNGVIGANGGIPWRIPADMAFFRATTLGKPIIMGRKQFETVGRSLPGRTNLVVSRRKDFQPDGVIVIDDLAAAIDHARAIATAEGAPEAMVIGGGEIYRQAIGQADRLYISHVALAPAGNVLFPAINPDQWEVVGAPVIPASPRDEAAFEVRIYGRRSRPPH